MRRVRGRQGVSPEVTAQERLPQPRIVEDRVVRDEDEQDNDVDDKDQEASSVPENSDTDSACEDDMDDVTESTAATAATDDDNAATGASSRSAILSELLSRLPPRTVNFVVRGCSGIGLIAAFSTIVSVGPIGLLSLSFMVLTKSFGEVIQLGYRQCGVGDKGTQRFCWFLFCLAVYCLDAPSCLRVIDQGLFTSAVAHPLPPPFDCAKMVVRFLFTHHSGIVFMAYLAAITWFVTSMKTKNYLGRYALFGWCHTTLLLTVVPVHMINQTLFTGGMIYYIVAMIIITINDICAYYVGFFCGKTPLIKLSPKKTLEGYVGGGMLTLFLGTLFTATCLNFPFLTCPAQIRPSFVSDVIANPMHALFNQSLFSVDKCQAAPIFTPTTYKVMGLEWDMAPFVLHGFYISAFASVLGPIGGFLASGFKRACNRKNFGSLIPGHGGVVDRCDCMFLMAAFINVYLNSVQQQQLLNPS